jgi:hypothetical protein
MMIRHIGFGRKGERRNRRETRTPTVTREELGPAFMQCDALTSGNDTLSAAVRS